jgi:hypothetical protein
MMRYHYEKPQIYLSMYGVRYVCEHPVYNSCTLFLIGDKGLAVIQQRFDARTKTTWWSEVDSWLTDDLYLHPNFKEYFDERAGACTDSLYPTVTVRQLMWALKMKPLPKARWETCFDRKDI